MRKLLFLPLLIFLAACGSATAPAATPAPESSDVGEAAAPRESDQETPQNGQTSEAGKASVVTGATPQEASVVREQDYVTGASDPKVTIIEYGDFQ
ncbi:MAG: hypothetical protein ACK2UJ_18140 [Candidatus Promineifilaceae bacterium]|jgi:protein-disulfide isomerase